MFSSFFKMYFAIQYGALFVFYLPLISTNWFRKHWCYVNKIFNLKALINIKRLNLLKYLKSITFIGIHKLKIKCHDQCLFMCPSGSCINLLTAWQLLYLLWYTPKILSLKVIKDFVIYTKYVQVVELVLSECIQVWEEDGLILTVF